MKDPALLGPGARYRVSWPDGTGGRHEGDLQQLDTSEFGAYYLLRTDRGSRVKLSAKAAALLMEPGHDGDSMIALAARLCGYDRRRGEPLRRRGFLFTIRLVRSEHVGVVAALLTSAFSLPLALVLISLTVVALVDFAMLHPVWRLANPLQVMEVYGLYVMSDLLHEFGHATAVRRFGGRPGEIGFTQYLAFPAFFSDVSEAWHLSRWQRVVVDLGGSYLQLVAAAGFIGAYLLTGAAIWADVVWLILGTQAFNLNPVLRMDGYWMLADVLGVCGLSRQPLLMLRGMLARMTGEQRDAQRWPTTVLVLLGLYTIASVSFWIYFMYGMSRQLMVESNLAGRLISDTIHHGRTALTLANAGEAASILISLVLILFALFWTGSSIARGIRGVIPTPRRSVERRSAA
jgi:hypothetical protein